MRNDSPKKTDRTAFQSGRGRRGVAAIEFGFWVPILALMIGSVLDLSHAMGKKVSIARAAADGVRSGASVIVGLTGGSGDALIVSTAEARADDVISRLGLENDNCVSTGTVTTSGSGLRKISLTVECDYTPLTGGLTPKYLVTLPEKIDVTFVMATEQQF